MLDGAALETGGSPPARDTAATRPSVLSRIAPIVVALAAAKVALQLATANLYGAHRDEFYYLASGHHLAWGYVDNPPLVPFLYRLQEAVFGHSVTALAVVPALLGGVYVLLAGAITADLGGGHRAQALAAAAAALGPIFLTPSHFLSTVSLDLVWWALGTWVVIRLVRSGDTRLWLAAGAVCGAGFLTKDTIVVWAAATLAGLAATPQRRLLASRWLAAGAAIAAVMAAPNIAWQAAHHWPTLTFTANLRAANGSTDTAQFLPLQLAMVTLGGTVLWVAGIAAVVRRAEWRAQRWLAVAYAVALVVFFASAGKSYYLGSAYLPLVAVGSVAVERRWAAWARRALLVAVVVTGLAMMPLFTPVLPRSTAVAAGLDRANGDLGGMLGWPHDVAAVAEVVNGLPPAERGSVVVLTESYAEAGAVDFYGPRLGLPPAISGHNTFWLWGYGHPAPGATVVAVGIPRRELAAYWGSVQPAGSLGADGAAIDPSERGAPLSVCRGQRQSWAVIWPHLRHYG